MLPAVDKVRAYRAKPLPAEFLATDGFLGRGVRIHRCSTTENSSTLIVTQMALGKLSGLSHQTRQNS